MRRPFNAFERLGGRGPKLGGAGNYKPPGEGIDGGGLPKGDGGSLVRDYKVPESGGGSIDVVPPRDVWPGGGGKGGGGSVDIVPPRDVWPGAGGKGGVLGSFKEGGKVEKTGAYKLEKGEEVIPAEEAGEPDKPTRDSEYRKVYIGRKKKKS